MSGAIVPPLNTEDIAIKSYDLGVNKYYALGHTVSFLYDHALTFGSEVECVWKRRFTLPTYLFLIFRYVTPLVCIINIVAENDPTWVGIRCSHWVWLPVALGPMIYATTGFILILRTHALYNRAYWVLYIAVPVYLAQISISLWTIPVGVPEPLPTGLIGCIPSEKLGTNARLIASYVASVVFDACIFILTIVRAMQLRNQRDHMALVSIIARDGAMYFFALFLLNLFNIFLLHMAIPELSGPNARFSR
ncbi:hypothetical protein K439DRAFT_1201637 [Ramaria rubella]|nr:hypothetical protein K439DRAFT_1201637 [Ramaria rubella]